jgi:hypothetical protein
LFITNIMLYLCMEQQKQNIMKRYSIELRVYSEDGDSYSGGYYDFDTIEQCRAFCKQNRSQVHSVLDYEDRDGNPRYFSF